MRGNWNTKCLLGTGQVDTSLEPASSMPLNSSTWSCARRTSPLRDSSIYLALMDDWGRDRGWFPLDPPTTRTEAIA